MRNHKTLKDVVNDNELFSKKQFLKTLTGIICTVQVSLVFHCHFQAAQNVVHFLTEFIEQLFERGGDLVLFGCFI